MTKEQWMSLKVGHYIRTRSGMPRKIIGSSNGSITLVSTRSRNGETTVYCSGDKTSFQRVIIKNKMI